MSNGPELGRASGWRKYLKEVLVLKRRSEWGWVDLHKKKKKYNSREGLKSSIPHKYSLHLLFHATFPRTDIQLNKEILSLREGGRVILRTCIKI